MTCQASLGIPWLMDMSLQSFICRQILYCQPSVYSVSKVIKAGLELTLLPRQALSLPLSCLNILNMLDSDLHTMLTAFRPLLKESRLWIKSLPHLLLASS